MNSVCHYCCHPFTREPLQIPIKYDLDKKKYVCEGCFCSWECMKTWNLEKNDSMKNIRFNLIQQMYQDMTKSHHEMINFAPNKKSLEMFGGNIDINTFRKHNKNIKVYEHPFIPLPCILETNLPELKLKKKQSKPKTVTLDNFMK